MERVFAVLLFATLLGGCSGIIIQPLTPAEASGFHKNRSSGYLVYEPTVYFTVGQGDGACAVGKPFVLPDYDRPYRIDAKAGLGKSGVEVTIVDGWALGAFKDNSDNTAILGALKGLMALDGDSSACPVGLYRIVKAGSGQIERVTLP